MMTNLPPALKHAVYSVIDVLPGEDPAAFQEFRQQVFAELIPVGILEEEIVDTIARLHWRARNLKTYLVASAARTLNDRMVSKFLSAVPQLHQLRVLGEEAHANAIKQACQNADEKVREELGEAYVFVDSNLGKVDTLKEEMDILERMHALIDRYLKRLLHIRGIKSLSASSIEPAAARTRRTAQSRRTRAQSRVSSPERAA